MSLSCGIVGLPNVGKSTLFNCLSGVKARIANFPFTTIEPNVTIVPVPDKRLYRISELVKPAKITPAAVEFADIAGLVRGASKGEGLGNMFLGHIRETDAIIHVLRCFDNDNIIHVDGSVDPLRDKEAVEFELLMKDIETVENKIRKLEKAIKSNDKTIIELMETYRFYLDHLSKGIPARRMNITNEKAILVKDASLLTSKPVLYVCNVDEKSILKGNRYVDMVQSFAIGENTGVVVISAALEAEITTMNDEDDRTMFLREAGLNEPGIDKLLHEAYRLLNLSTYFTAGEKEVRAWTIRNGMDARQAAGVIHSDFEKGFIRAEVIKYDDFIKYKSETACKEAGKMFVEGKDYMVQDGDMIYFRFNV
ncbi:MAG: redox-regulated ATPase YchF [Bacteroidetes bacterium]|nr:redox-regulated ATPase YchF [Bacteroidota bacterium]